jgi:beta-glucosidase
VKRLCFLGLLIPLVLSGPAGFPVTDESGVEPHTHRLIFPHLVDGRDDSLAVRSSILLFNNSGRTVRGSAQFFRDDGTAWYLDTGRDPRVGGLRIAATVGTATLGTGPVTGSVTATVGTGSVTVGTGSYPFELEPWSLLRIETRGAGEPVKGWCRVDSDRPLVGSGTYLVESASGEFLSEVGIGDSPPSAQQMIFVHLSDGLDSGLALCNPSGESVEITLELRDLGGSTLDSKTESLAGRMQRAEFASEIFPWIAEEKEFRGVLVVQSAAPISVVALRTRGTNYTSLPSASGSISQTEEVLFAQVGDGAFGPYLLQTEFLLLNPWDEDVEASIDLFGGDGTPLQSGVAAELPARGAARMSTGGTLDPGWTGWGRLRGSRPLRAQAVFRILDASSGDFVSELGIGGEPSRIQPMIHVRSVDEGGTGLALANPSEEEVTIRLALRGARGEADQSLDGGQFVEIAEIVLPPRGHTAQFVPEFFDGVPDAFTAFEGNLRAHAFFTRFGEDVPAPLAAVTLQARGPRYTSLPVAPRVISPTRLASFDSRADAILSRMTLEEKVGQMTQAERSALRRDQDIQTFFLGSVLSGGGSAPPVNKVQSWAEMHDRFQSQALKTRLAIPLLYGIDAVHGHNNVRGAVIFPHNIGLGATRNPELVEKVARVTASEVRATGMNWTFSPCLAVPRDERWGRTYEGFSESPDVVRGMGEAAVRGYQDFDLDTPRAIVACAKHYVGDGGTAWGTGSGGRIDQGDTRVDEATLRRIHLPPYLGALEVGVATIMVSFSSWNGVKLSGHRYLLTDVLKGELGFEGFLLSDWAAIDQLPGDYREQVKTAVNAGLDMIMVPHRYEEFFHTLKNLVESGEVSLERIDDAVRRILRVKLAAGLFDRSPLTDATFQERFGSAAHRELAREAVRRSLVLLRNQGNLLPLSKNLSRLHVTGRNADDLGNQCGGWTISWQGSSGAITEGTTILEAIRGTVEPGTRVTFSADGSGAAGADVAVVVVGETPYAEMLGDRADLALSLGDLATIQNVRSAGVPFVLVLVSGRPLILGPAAEQAPAILAAWLPGTEGQGVADVLFGDYAPTGKLPFTWPRSLDQIPSNVGDGHYDPLYPFDFGLTYGQDPADCVQGK